MCEPLTKLAQFVQDRRSTPISDVIRIACGACGQQDVCAGVDSREFDQRQALPNEDARRKALHSPFLPIV